MIQEYFFIGEKYRREIEQYNHKSIKKEIRDIENSDCWIVMFSLVGENEDSANLLSDVHEYIFNSFQPIVLSDGCSAYYNRALYSLFNEFERKLRKLLYLKSALSESSIDIECIKDIEKKDFGAIFTLLFTDNQFVTDVRKSINEKTWQFTRNELLEALQNIPENTFWDNCVGKDAVPLLRSDFLRVKDFRNDIMHAHSMNITSFRLARKLIKKINEQIDKEISKIIDNREEKLQSIGSKDFSISLSNAIKDMDTAKVARNLSELFTVYQAAFNEAKILNAAVALKECTHIAKLPEAMDIMNFFSLSGLATIQKRFQEMLKIQDNIASALEALQKVDTNMEQFKITLPPEILELQKSLQMFRTDLALSKMMGRIKEITGESHNG